MNVISISGNIGRDAEIRATPSGDSVCNFSIADSQGKDKPTIWWGCQLWGKRAVSLSQYLTKGTKVTVSGQVTEREYKDKDGTPRKSMEVRVIDVALMGGGEDRKQAQQEYKRPSQDAVKARDTRGSGFDDMDDDIPF